MGDAYESVTVDIENHVAQVTLVGPAKGNAMGPALSGVLGRGRSARPRADFHATVLRMQGAINAVADCRTPTIASVHGWCIGGGAI